MNHAPQLPRNTIKAELSGYLLFSSLCRGLTHFMTHRTAKLQLVFPILQGPILLESRHIENGHMNDRPAVWHSLLAVGTHGKPMIRVGAVVIMSGLPLPAVRLEGVVNQHDCTGPQTHDRNRCRSSERVPTLQGRPRPPP